MFIAGKMLDNTIRPALSVLLATLHLPPPKKLSETGFQLLCLSTQKTHTCWGEGVWVYVIDGGGKGNYSIKIVEVGIRQLL
jgi:hypothetical protein